VETRQKWFIVVEYIMLGIFLYAGVYLCIHHLNWKYVVAGIFMIVVPLVIATIDIFFRKRE